MKKISYSLLLCFGLLSLFSYSQSTYDESGPTPYNSSVLLNTESTSSSTGWVKIHEYNAGAGASSNEWSTTNAIPFAFEYFGTPVTHFMVSKNFLLTFDTTLTGTVLPSSISADNTSLPNANLPNNTIAYQWDGFGNPAPINSNDDVWTKTFGTAPNRQLWVKNYSFEVSGQSFVYNFVVLEESTNNIYVLDARNATVGNGSRTVGVQKNSTTAIQNSASPNISAIASNVTAIGGNYYLFNPKLLVPVNAGISSINSPGSPLNLGNQAVNATIRNFGIDTLTSATVNWSVNGAIQTPVPFSGSLKTDSSTNINLGNFNFTTTSTIEVWTSMPNGGVDGEPSNDTMSVTLYPALSGNYTINSGAPNSATNFQSFADFTQTLDVAGVNGPVVATVVSGSGPYTEQVLFNNVVGASATNTITIQGNGETISFAPLAADKRIVGFDNAQHFTLDSLTILGTSTTYGFGVHFMNRSDSNAIVNSIIDLSAVTSTSSVNSTNIVSSSSITSTSGSGDNANALTIDNNQLIGGASGGGYYGIKLTGISATVNNLNNTITNNTITNTYSYCINLDDQENALVSGNDLSRLDRTSVTTGGGVLIGGGDSKGNLIEKNAIHDLNTGDATPTAANYGIFISAADATASEPNVVQNNIIYNLTGTGIIYAIYNSGSDYTNFYHNTISLDDATATSGTTRGFYQTTSATGVDFRNNIISITRGGTGVKHGIYLNTTASTITADYNNVYINSAGSGLQHYGRYGTLDLTDLSDWQTANSNVYGQNSFENDPKLTSNTNLIPTGFAPDNSGVNLSVLDDYAGVTRSATPDMGAYEFVGPTCPEPSTFVGSNNTATTTDISWVENGSATQWEIEYDTAGFVLGTGNSVIVNTTPSATLSGLTSGESYDIYVRAICGPMDTSTYSLYNFFFAGLPLNGVYTLNSALPTSGTNYQTVTDFTQDLIASGISGPVTLNIVSGSGPYAEQLILTSFSGSSATNTVTINGNGETISFSPTSTDKRIVGFDDVQHVILDSLNIVGTSSLYGFGIHFMNRSDSNVVRNSIIDLSSITSTSSTNSTNILSSSSIISTSGSGDNANGLVIDNNQIIGGASGGGYYGIKLTGISATVNNLNNSITNNTITNTYSYCIYLDDQENAIVSGNDINRLDRTTVSTGGGVFIAGGDSKGNLIEKNAIHDLNTGDATPTSANYALYISSADATASEPNVFQNNVIYNLTGTGTIYAIYNIGSDYTNFYHNTISLDDASATSGTTRGFYQTTTATGVDFRNNIISITRGGSGTKHGIYLNSTASTVVADYNNVYLNSSGTGAQHYGRYTADQTTLLDWQTVNTGAFGQNSYDASPLFTGANNLVPSSPVLNNVGVNLSVLDDFYDSLRGPIPDLGAIEFVPPSCPQPSSLFASVVGATTTTVNWIENGSATQWEVEYDTAGFLPGMGRNSVLVNVDTFTTLTGLTAQTDYEFYVRAICAAMDTSMYSASGNFKTLCAPFTAPFSDNVENHSANTSTAPFDSECWSTTANNTTNTWNISTSGTTPSTGTGPLLANSGSNFFYFEASSGVAGNEAYLESPEVDLSTLFTPRLSFFYHMHGDNRGIMADLYIEAFDGVRYFLLDSLIGEQQLNQADPFLQKTIDLSGFTGVTRIRFTAAWNGAQWGDISIDDFRIEETPSCIRPNNLNSTVLGSDSAIIDWTATNTPQSPEYEVSYGPVGFTPGSGTQFITTSTTDTLVGLMSSTNYEFYVRAICGRGDTSFFSNANSFLTACAPLTAPYSMNFDGGAAGDFNNAGIPCWQAIGPGAADLDIVTATDQGATLPTSPNVVEFNDGTWPTDSSILVSPQFSDISTGLNRIRFQAAFESANGLSVNMYVGVMTDPNNSQTFIPLDTIDGSDLDGTTNFGEIIVDLDNTTLIGTAEYIAFAHGVGTFEAYIDSFVYEPIPPNDLSVTTVVRPNGGCGITADSVEVIITNIGTATQSNFPVGFSVNGTAITPETFTGSIPRGGSVNYVFSTLANFASAGSYSIDAYTLLTTDSDNNNDSASSKVNIFNSLNSFPYSESFETGNGGWLTSGTNTWELGAPAGTVINSASDGTQAWVTDLDSLHGNDQLSSVNSPCFDFTNIPNPYISMDIWYDIESQWDGALLEASTDGGATWSIIGQKNDPNNWYNDSARVIADLGIAADGRAWTGDGTVAGVPGSNGWVKAEHTLDGLGGLSSVRLRVTFASDAATTSEGFAFDNVKVFDSLIVAQDPYYPIAILNTEDAAGVADSLNVSAFTSGTVVGIDLDGNNGLSFTIIDMSSGVQEGINIFNFNDVSNYVVTEGDSILVHGDIAQFNGLTELIPDSISIISTGNTIPTPIVVSDLTEAEESRWLSIPTDYVVLDTYTSGSSNLRMFNGTDTLVMRIDSDTDIDDTLANLAISIIPGDTICGVVGIGGQFDGSSPFTDGYQIFPMRWSDLNLCRDILTGIDDVEVSSAQLKLVPNPTNGQFEIRTSGFNNSIVNVKVRDVNGRVISEENISNATSAFNKSFDLTGNAKGMYFISIQDGENVIIEKLIVQ